MSKKTSFGGVHPNEQMFSLRYIQQLEARETVHLCAMYRPPFSPIYFYLKKNILFSGAWGVHPNFFFETYTTTRSQGNCAPVCNVPPFSPNAKVRSSLSREGRLAPRRAPPVQQLRALL